MRRILFLFGLLAAISISSSAITYDTNNPLEVGRVIGIFPYDTSSYNSDGFNTERSNDSEFLITYYQENLYGRFNQIVIKYKESDSEIKELYIVPDVANLEDGTECSYIVTDEQASITNYFGSPLDNGKRPVRVLAIDFSTMTMNVHDKTIAEMFDSHISLVEKGECTRNIKLKYENGTIVSTEVEHLGAGSYIFFGWVAYWNYGYPMGHIPSEQYLALDEEIIMTEGNFSDFSASTEGIDERWDSYRFYIDEDIRMAKFVFDVETKSLRLERSDNYFSVKNSDGIELEYTVIENAETPQVSLVGVIDAEGEVVVPSKVRHSGVVYLVTEIANDAFSSDGITSVKLPDSVVKIGTAFRGRKNLSKVELGKGITSIPNYAFYNSGIKSINLSENIESIGLYAFYNSDLELIEIPDNVKSIGLSAFEMTLSLKSVKIGEGINIIRERTFCNSAALHYKFPISLEKIESMAFGITENLEEDKREIFDAIYDKRIFDFPDVETFLYLNCASDWASTEGGALSKFNLSIGGKNVSSLRITDDLNTIPSQVANVFLVSIDTGNGMKTVPAVNTAITTLILGTNVTRVLGSYPNVKIVISHATAKAPSIESGTFPLLSFDQEYPGSAILENEATYNTYSRANIWKDLNLTHGGMVANVILNEAGSLGAEVSNQCGVPLSKVVDLTVHGVMSVDDFGQIMSNMPAILSLNIADVLLEDNALPTRALQDKITLQTLILPTSVTKIQSHALSGCYSLSSLILPESLVEICEYAFNNCTGINQLSFPSGLTKIGNNAFAGCASISDIELPASLTELGESAFMGSGVKTLKCYSALETIEIDAFRGTPLNSIELSEGLVTIKSGAFADTQISQRLNLPRSVRSIGCGAFSGVSGISGLLNIHDNITELGEGAFENTGIDGVFITNKIETIPDRLFAGCKKLDRVQLLDNVTAVGVGAFKGCTSLYDLRLSENLKTIDAFSFAETGITTVYMPEGFYSVGANSFESCTGLRTVSLPSTTKTIGENAFAFCRGLRSLSVSALTPPSVFASTFKGVNTDNCILSIPTSSKAKYQNANIWGRFTTMRNDIAVSIEGEGEITFNSEEEIDEELAEDGSEEFPVRAPIHRVMSESFVVDGSTLYIPADGKVRFVITAKEGNDIVSLVYNDVDVTDEVIDGVYIPSEYKRNATLHVVFGFSTDIKNLDADREGLDVLPRYYNLQGIRVTNPTPGIYLVKRGNTVSKVLVR